MAPSSLLPVTDTTIPATTDDHHNNDKGVKHVVDTVAAGDDVQSNPSVDNFPIIDLSGLDASTEERLSTIQAINSACEEWGFFVVTNHGIKESLMEEMLKVVEGFFSTSDEEKMKYTSDLTDDTMQRLWYMKQIEDGKEILRQLGHPIQPHFHLWPENPPNYKQVTKEYLEEVWNLGLRIMGAVFEGLGLEKDYCLEKIFGEGRQSVAIHCYPPCPDLNLAIGLPAHRDPNVYAIILQNDVDGLEVLHKDKWVSIPHIPGALTFNIGHCLKILSNNKYDSVEHRAVANEKRTRYSVVTGNGPAFTAIVEPFSELVVEKNIPKDKPMQYRDHLGMPPLK